MSPDRVSHQTLFLESDVWRCLFELTKHQVLCDGLVVAFLEVRVREVVCVLLQNHSSETYSYSNADTKIRSKKKNAQWIPLRPVRTWASWGPVSWALRASVHPRRLPPPPLPPLPPRRPLRRPAAYRCARLSARRFSAIQITPPRGRTFEEQIPRKRRRQVPSPLSCGRPPLRRSCRRSARYSSGRAS